jgi:capsular polysaccharide biosynthesis protein
MRIDHLRDATVLPLREQRAGIFVEGLCIESSLLHRHWGRIYSPGDCSEPTRAIAGAAMFAGYLIPHFGHFLLESLSRLWAAHQHPELPLVWCGSSRYTTWQREILELLGIRNDFIHVDQVTRVEKLLLPSPGYVIQTTFHESHAKFLSVVDPSPIQHGRKCWVSRSMIPVGTADRLERERDLESQLLARGWSIFRPEEFSIIEQLRYLSSCEVIAGIPGSAFHALILLKELGSRIKLVDVREPNQNFVTIANRKRFRQEILPVSTKTHTYTRDGLLVVSMPDFREVLSLLAN